MESTLWGSGGHDVAVDVQPRGKPPSSVVPPWPHDDGPIRLARHEFPIQPHRVAQQHR
jgi:hypothetical protein